eukprot:3218643-Pyramimonas_sp.AAC.1
MAPAAGIRQESKEMVGSSSTITNRNSNAKGSTQTTYEEQDGEQVRNIVRGTILEERDEDGGNWTSSRF